MPSNRVFFHHIQQLHAAKPRRRKQKLQNLQQQHGLAVYHTIRRVFWPESSYWYRLGTALGHAARKSIFDCPWIGYPWVVVRFIHVSVLGTASNEKRSEGEDETDEREDVQYEEHQVVAWKKCSRLTPLGPRKYDSCNSWSNRFRDGH